MQKGALLGYLTKWEGTLPPPPPPPLGAPPLLIWYVVHLFLL